MCCVLRLPPQPSPQRTLTDAPRAAKPHLPERNEGKHYPAQGKRETPAEQHRALERAGRQPGWRQCGRKSWSWPTLEHTELCTILLMQYKWCLLLHLAKTRPLPSMRCRVPPATHRCKWIAGQLQGPRVSYLLLPCPHSLTNIPAHAAGRRTPLGTRPQAAWHARQVVKPLDHVCAAEERTSTTGHTEPVSFLRVTR